MVWEQLGKPLRVREVKEATALEAGLYTWVGLGHYADVQEAVDEAVRWEKQYHPDADKHRRYQSLHDRWKTIYPSMRELTEELDLQPLE